MPVPALRTSARLRLEDVHHLGLRFDRFLAAHDDVDARSELLLSIRTLPTPVAGVYSACFEKWAGLLRERSAITKTWRTLGRLCFGAGDETVLEVGLRFHKTYGVAVIPGSAQKGLVRRWLVRMASSDAADALLGKAPSIGDEGHAGSVTFHDALWVPGSEGLFSIDTITVHHPKYYQGRPGAAPTDWDSPTPISLLSAQGRFLFAIEGTEQSASIAMKVLGTALKFDGIGAKTLKGYGRFDVPDTDCVPVSESHVGLFSAERVRLATEANAVPAPTRLTVQTNLSRDPGRAVFKFVATVNKRRMGSETKDTDISIFPGDDDDARTAFRDGLILRLKKRDFLSVEVEVAIDGNMMTVIKVTKA